MIFDVIDWPEDQGKLPFEIIRTMGGEGAPPGGCYLYDLDHISPPQNAPTHPSTLSLIGSASVTLLT
jgi:hypothetical protein